MFPTFESPPHDMKVRLLPPVKTRVRFEGPDGKPPGEKSGISLVQFGVTLDFGPDGRRSVVFDAPVPRAISDQLDLHLGRDGVLVLECLPPGSVYSLDVTGSDLGTQRATSPVPPPGKEGQASTPPGETVVRLRNAGSLSGRVVAGDPKAVGGLQVRVWTRPAPPQVQRPSEATQSVPIVGHGTAVTDENGRFEIKKIAAGRAEASVEMPAERSWFPPAQIATTVEPGKRADLRVELVRGVRVRGRVVAEDSGEGIEGVVVSVGGKKVTTDAKGHYEALVSPGRVPVNVVRVPLPWLSPIGLYRGEEVPADRALHELQTIRLKRGLPLEGTVVDEEGRPVAGARVSAAWQKTDGTIIPLGGDSSVSGKDGKFVLKQVPGDVGLELAASTDERATPDFVTVPPQQQRKPLLLTVRRDAAVTFEGRVLDEEGKPVPDVRVQFRKAMRIPGGINFGQSVVFFGEGPLKTDAAGTFRTPTKVPRNEQYSVAVEAPGMVKYESGYVTPKEGGEVFRWPDVVLRRERAAAGVVVGRDGKPVRGVTVWSHGVRPSQRVTAETDGNGRFRLAGLHPDARLVFVGKEGHRPTGGVIPRTGELRVTIEPEDAPPGEPLRSIRRRPEERKRLLKDLIVPILPRLGEESDSSVAEALKRLAPYDPGAVRSHFDRLRTDHSRAEVLTALGELDDALESASLVEDPYRRTYQYLGIADTAEDAERKRRILGEALVHARLVERPDQRVVLLRGIADRLLALGDRGAALKVLDEGAPVARELAPAEWSGFARGHFAETFALFDPGAALELIQALKDDSERTRHAGNIAHKLAGVRPAEAEEALKLAKDDHYVTPYAVRVCYRMAPADLERARRIADRIGSPQPELGPVQKAHAYGVMAMALAGKDPATARGLLAHAFDQLALPRAGRVYAASRPFPVAMTLLGYAETVDPARTREYFWRTLALHPGPALETWSPDEALRQKHTNTAQLVLLLALYGQYPDVQAELIDPVFRYWSDPTNRKKSNTYLLRENTVFMAMALADPRRAIEWHTEFHAKVDKEFRRTIPQPWMVIADAFAHEGPELHKHITEQGFRLWVIDKEDL
ncbi:MAG TPA: hypothetical protein VIL46_19090 [Gemmataceae bacterium]